MNHHDTAGESSLRRDEFCKAIDGVLDNLHSEDFEKLIFLCKSQYGRDDLESTPFDEKIGACKNDHEAVGVARKLLISSLMHSAHIYSQALREAGFEKNEELRNAYQLDALELRGKMRFFTQMLTDYCSRKEQRLQNMLPQLT